MGYFPVRYDSRVVIYDRKMFIRLATDVFNILVFSTIKIGQKAKETFKISFFIEPIPK